MTLWAVALCKLLCANALRIFSMQVALCCQSCRNVLRVLPLYSKVAILQPELSMCTPRTTTEVESCEFADVYSAYYVCTYKLRFLSRSCGSALRALRLHLEVESLSRSCRSVLRVLRLYSKATICCGSVLRVLRLHVKNPISV